MAGMPFASGDGCHCPSAPHVSDFRGLVPCVPVSAGVQASSSAPNARCFRRLGCFFNRPLSLGVLLLQSANLLLFLLLETGHRFRGTVVGFVF